MFAKKDARAQSTSEQSSLIPAVKTFGFVTTALVALGLFVDRANKDVNPQIEKQDPAGILKLTDLPKAPELLKPTGNTVTPLPEVKIEKTSSSNLLTDSYFNQGAQPSDTNFTSVVPPLLSQKNSTPPEAYIPHSSSRENKYNVQHERWKGGESFEFSKFGIDYKRLTFENEWQSIEVTVNNEIRPITLGLFSDMKTGDEIITARTADYKPDGLNFSALTLLPKDKTGETLFGAEVEYRGLNLFGSHKTIAGTTDNWQSLIGADLSLKNVTLTATSELGPEFRQHVFGINYHPNDSFSVRIHLHTSEQNPNEQPPYTLNFGLDLRR